MKNYQRTLILEERNSEQKMEWKFVHIHFSKIQIFHSIVCILLTITSFWMHKNHISTKAQMELALKFVYKTGLLLQKVPNLSASSIRVCCIKCKLKALFPKKKKKTLYLQNLGNSVLNQNPHQNSEIFRWQTALTLLWSSNSYRNSKQTGTNKNGHLKFR